jgi:sn-glycerol 3-phosphate transport system substrate-binding protein
MTLAARRMVGALVALGMVLAACGSGESILDAGNPPRPAPTPTATVAPTTTVTATTVAGQTTTAAGPTQPGQTTTAPAPTEPPTTQPAPTTTTTPLDALPKCPVDALPAEGEAVTITFWHGMTGALEDALIALTDEYNASQTRVRVRLENQGGYDQTMDKYLRSGSGSRPDMVQFSEPVLQRMIDTDSFVPVGACIAAGGFDTSGFLPRAIEAYSTAGVTWAMPFNVSCPVLFYNKTMFANAGLDPNDPPVSLDEVRSYSQQIVTAIPGAVGLALESGADSGGGWFIEQWFAKLALPYADNGNGRLAPATRVLFDSPEGINLITEVQALVTDGLAAYVGENASGQDQFLRMADPRNPAAMAVGTSAALGTILSVVRGGLIPGITEADIGVGPMPGPTGETGALVGGGSLYIVDGKGDDHTAAVWDYIKHLVAPQSQSTWASQTGYVPVQDAAIGLEPLASTYTTDPRFKVGYDQLLAVPAGPTSLGPVLGPLREIRMLTAGALGQVLQGADPTTELTAAAASANRLITEYTSQFG